MKKIISKYKGFAAFIFLLISAMVPLQNAYSQNIKIEEPKLCGSYIIDTAALRAAKEFESAKSRSLLSTSYSIRVYFHICRDDNGTNAGATEAQIKSEFDHLVADYANNNICFINMGLTYINNSTLNNNASTANPSLLQPYLVPNCINIFYHATVIGAGGTAYSIPSIFCSIARGNIGSSRTISHEVGHCFGLLHTFEPTTGYENINGSNSSTAADQITDTPADPYAYKGATCFTTSACCYTGNCTDPNGQSNFNPPYSNMMAYWWAFGYTNLSITSAQYTRVNSYLSSNDDLQDCESPDDLTVGPVTYTSDYHMFSATNTLTTKGSVNLGGSTVTTLGGNLVSIQPGFVASSSGGALILVRSSACSSPVSRSISQTNSKVITKINNNNKTNDLKIYPNPFSQKFIIEFDLAKAAQASINVYDLAGRQLKSISKSFLKEGTHQFTTDASNLPAGVYIVVLQAEKFRTAQKIIKAN